MSELFFYKIQVRILNFFDYIEVSGIVIIAQCKAFSSAHEIAEILSSQLLNTGFSFFSQGQCLKYFS
jgi:hypothetical protein